MGKQDARSEDVLTRKESAMSITSRNIEGAIHNTYFDNDVWVGITPSEQTWEYQKGDDEDTYTSGGYVLDGCTVIDYDGCFELPKEVMLALREESYDLDL